MSTPVKVDASTAIAPMRLDPQALIAKAIESGATIEMLERLVNLAKDIRATSAREAFFESMASFKRDCPRIKKGATANAGQYSYNYATLDGILDVVDPLLGKVGLTISWQQKHEGNAVHASCVITHRMGHQEASGFIAIPFESAGRMNPAQRVGSAATYAKRYSLLAILGLAPEDDDDARGTAGVVTQAEPGNSSRPLHGGGPDSDKVETEITVPSTPGVGPLSDPDTPERVDESTSLFQLPEEIAERENLTAKIGGYSPARIIVNQHRLGLGDGDWKRLDVAALSMLLTHLEQGKK